MMTLTRQPPAVRDQLERLTADARRLWDREPGALPEHREELLSELTAVDLDLERLGLRSRCTPFDRRDLDELSACAHRLNRLRRHWALDA
ncbi:MAG: hypothetical protein OEW42_05810 [Acidimicrobiia bacterium]|nr:hypothetical protein [Acidimicrobiia bacterium]MDH5236297.1 hypothetical protein [Acidimicrobiia bacterium]